MTRFPLLAVVWAAVLVLGFAVVIGLGAPPATAADELEAALNPPTPVTEDVARASAATIVRLSYPELTSVEPSVRSRTDFGIEHWVIEYSDPEAPTPTGVRISITTEAGKVEVTSFP
jgi:hypothetical protein